MEMAVQSHFDDAQLVEIGDYIKSHLKVWIQEAQPVSPPLYDRELMERMVRVEEEIKHLTKAMYEGFDRFDKRFEQVDKRFESMQTSIDKRFAFQTALIGLGFTMMTVLMTVFKFVG